MEDGDGVYHFFVEPVAGVFGRQDVFHAGGDGGGYEMRLEVHGAEAEGEEQGVLVLEGGVQEVGVCEGAFLDGEAGVGGEGGGGGGLGEDGDVEVAVRG